MGLLAPSLLLPGSDRGCPRDYPNRLVWRWRERWWRVARTACHMLHMLHASRTSCVQCLQLATFEANSNIVFSAQTGISRFRLVYGDENILGVYLQAILSKELQFYWFFSIKNITRFGIPGEHQNSLVRMLDISSAVQSQSRAMSCPRGYSKAFLQCSVRGL